MDRLLRSYTATGLRGFTCALACRRKRGGRGSGSETGGEGAHRPARLHLRLGLEHSYKLGGRAGGAVAGGCVYLGSSRYTPRAGLPGAPSPPTTHPPTHPPTRPPTNPPTNLLAPLALALQSRRLFALAGLWLSPAAAPQLRHAAVHLHEVVWWLGDRLLVVMVCMTGLKGRGF